MRLNRLSPFHARLADDVRPTRLLEILAEAGNAVAGMGAAHQFEVLV